VQARQAIFITSKRNKTNVIDTIYFAVLECWWETMTNDRYGVVANFIKNRLWICEEEKVRVQICNKVDCGIVV